MRVLNQLIPILYQPRFLDRLGYHYPIPKYAIPPAYTSLIVTAFIARSMRYDGHKGVPHLFDAFVDFID